MLLFTLEVKNTFHLVRWMDISNALHNSFHILEHLFRHLNDYLHFRLIILANRNETQTLPLAQWCHTEFNLRFRLLVDYTKDGQRTLNVTFRVAQGLILSPNLWNVTYERYLNLECHLRWFWLGMPMMLQLLLEINVKLAQFKLKKIMCIDS